MSDTKKRRPIDLLKHPITVLLAIAGGFAIGALAKDVANAIAPIGDLYLLFIQMSTIPILITAIISSLASLIRNKAASGSIGRLALILIASIVVISLTGVLLGQIGQPGSGLNEASRAVLGAQVNAGDSGILSMPLVDDGAAPPVKQTSLWDFVMKLIPSNIFTSLSAGKTLELVFFSIIFGIVLGFIRNDSAIRLVDLSQALLEAFQKLIYWAMYALPFGLICLVAKQVSDVGVEVFNAMLKFIGLFWAGGLAIFLIATAVIWVRSGLRNPLRVIKAVFDPIMISFATRNSLAALPSAIDSLERKLGFDGTVVKLTMPLGITIGRFGNIFYFALASFFVVQLYGATLDFTGYAIITLGSILAGIATAGSSGILTLSMIGYVLKPLGLPIEAVLVIMMAIDSIVDPMRTFLIIYVNMAVTALSATRAVPDGASLSMNGDSKAPQMAAPQAAAQAEAPQAAAQATQPPPERAPAQSFPERYAERTAAPVEAPIARKLRVAFAAEDQKPFLYRDAQGNLAGIEAGLARELARRLGAELSPVRSALGREGLLDLVSDSVDLAIARLSKPEASDERAAFSVPYMSVTRKGERELACVAVSRKDEDLLPAVNRCLADLAKEGFMARLIKSGGEGA